MLHQKMVNFVVTTRRGAAGQQETTFLFRIYNFRYVASLHPVTFLTRLYNGNEAWSITENPASWKNAGWDKQNCLFHSLLQLQRCKMHPRESRSRWILGGSTRPHSSSSRHRQASWRSALPVLPPSITDNNNAGAVSGEWDLLKTIENVRLLYI